jgi:hypothetical protein
MPPAMLVEKRPLAAIPKSINARKCCGSQYLQLQS